MGINKKEKKHFKQMNFKEVMFLNSIIQSFKKLTFSSHSLQRMDKKGITKTEIYYAFKNYSIIEFNVHNGQPRVLIRDNNGTKNNTCIVICLINGNVITAYKNSDTDIHCTMDWNEYNPRINVIEEYKKLNKNYKVNKKGA